jgi:hypothetical protein
MYQTMSCKHETTEYVLREDHDRIVQQAKKRIADLELELRRMERESDWRWYHDSLEAVQRRYEAQLDLYRKPIDYVPVTEVKLRQRVKELEHALYLVHHATRAIRLVSDE